MKKVFSIRGRLAVSYAAIAFLTSVALGGLVFGIVQMNLTRLDQNYLADVAEMTQVNLANPQPLSLKDKLMLTAYGTNTRIQAFDNTGKLLEDTGSPQSIDFSAIATVRPEASGFQSDIVKRASGEAVSKEILDVPVSADKANGAVLLRFMEAPSAGGSVLEEIQIAWLISSTIAVVLGGLVGFLISRGISSPLVKLARVTKEMAEGDLGVRAEVSGAVETRQVAVSFNDMAEQMEDTIHALQQFVSDAAHQIGTPLTALRSDLELLSQSEDSNTQRLVQRALGQERRIEKLANNLLKLSRLDADKDMQPAEVISVNKTLDEVAIMVASRIDQAGVDFEFIPYSEEINVFMNAEQLKDSVENLLDNAVKFTSPGGVIELGYRRVDDRVVVWVQDSGIGVAVEDRDFIFDRFYRSRKAADVPGSGLGLAIVKSYVTIANGDVVLVPTSVGTRIEIRLPVQK